MGAVAIVATFLRFYLIDEKAIWMDEAFSLWVARHGLTEIWRWLIRIDQHPPLYYSLLHVWIGLFGDLQGAVRTLSALASALTVPVFYAAARRLLDRPLAMIAVTILAVSPFHVRFAQETRMYALLTLEMACVLFFLARLPTPSASPPVQHQQSAHASQDPLLSQGRAMRRRRTAPGLRRDWIGLAVAQALVMLTHNTAAVYLPVALNAAMGIIFLLSRRVVRSEQKEVKGVLSPHLSAAAGPPEFWIRWIKFQGLALLLWLPWAMPFAIQVIGVEREFWLPPPWPRLALDTFHNFHFAFLPSDLPLLPVWMGAYPVLALVGLVGLLSQGCRLKGAYISMAGRWRRRPPKQKTLQDDRTATSLLRLSRAEAHSTFSDNSGSAILLACLFTLPHIIALLVSLHRPIYSDHTLIWTTLPYFLLVAAGIRTLSQALARFPHAGSDTEGIAAEAGTGRYAGLLPTARRGLQAAILLAVLALSGLSLNGYYFYFQKEGWDQAASHVAQHARPGDVIFFNATWVQIPFEYYYRHYGLDTELRGLPVDLFERGILEPKMTETETPYIHQLIAERKRVWLVYSHDWYTDPTKIIPREIEKSLQETGRAKFVGLQVIRYEARE